jgi:hypothetical protein
MMTPHSELEWHQNVRARAAARVKKPKAVSVAAPSRAAYFRQYMAERRALNSDDGSAPYPRGFALDREAFMAAFLAFWGIGGVAPDVAKRNGIEGVSP